jgi:hypothetical protein
LILKVPFDLKVGELAVIEPLQKVKTYRQHQLQL